jgi:hypothetical protein
MIVELKWKWVTNKWKKRAQLTPSVALAITNTVSNVALAIAIGQGVAIAWWRKVHHIVRSQSVHQFCPPAVFKNHEVSFGTTFFLYFKIVIKFLETFHLKLLGIYLY